MSIYKPYTYLIGWSRFNIYYYGVEYSNSTKVANPKNLWKTYFTSSKEVSKFVDEYGSPDILKVRRIFNDSYQARNWERKVIDRCKLVEDKRFLNKSNGSDKFLNSGGYNLSERTKNNQSKSWTDERKAAHSLKKTGEGNPRFGKKLSKSTKKKIKENKKTIKGKDHHYYGKKRTAEDKRKIRDTVLKTVSTPEHRKLLSEKAKERCTEEWRENKKLNNKRKVCCIQCQRELGLSSLGRHFQSKHNSQ